jgi:hypothetical protein
MARNNNTERKQLMKKLALMIATVCVIGCANPQFEQYARSRQDEITRMPNGEAKQQAQADLTAKRKIDDKRKKDHGGDTAAVIGSTVLFGIPGLVISSVMVSANHAGDGDNKRNRELYDEAEQYNRGQTAAAYGSTSR